MLPRLTQQCFRLSLCSFSSHHHFRRGIIASSHHHIITSSHHHIIASSHLHIFTPSHRHIRLSDLLGARVGGDLGPAMLDDGEPGGELSAGETARNSDSDPGVAVPPDWPMMWGRTWRKGSGVVRPSCCADLTAPASRQRERP
eukprot:2250099-Rhodomonas_salina.1